MNHMLWDSQSIDLYLRPSSDCVSFWSLYPQFTPSDSQRRDLVWSLVGANVRVSFAGDVTG